MWHVLWGDGKLTDILYGRWMVGVGFDLLFRMGYMLLNWMV
jgi:hypothetical protein